MNVISCLIYIWMLSFWITFLVSNVIILLFRLSFNDSARFLCIEHVSCYWEAIKRASLKLMRSLFLQTDCHSHEMNNSNSMNSSFSLLSSLMATNNLSVYSYLAYMTLIICIAMCRLKRNGTVQNISLLCWLFWWTILYAVCTKKKLNTQKRFLWAL